MLRPGDLVLLAGPLGAGKTALAQGVGAGLGVSGVVTSPTFVIARLHRGTVPLVHVDAYRLGSISEVDDLDLDTTQEESVTLIEWGHGLAERLADSYLKINIDRLDDDTRVVTLEPHGGQWQGRLEEAGLC
jgi:tRNA threonylcarbamoyladenosine biosynthesis protein TsaE